MADFCFHVGFVVMWCSGDGDYVLSYLWLPAFWNPKILILVDRLASPSDVFYRVFCFSAGIFGCSQELCRLQPKGAWCMVITTQDTQAFACRGEVVIEPPQHLNCSFLFHPRYCLAGCTFPHLPGEGPWVWTEIPTRAHAPSRWHGPNTVWSACHLSGPVWARTLCQIECVRHVELYVRWNAR